MQALRVFSFGGPETVRIEDIPRPEPKPGEILIKVHAAGINPVDWKIRSGYLPFLNLQPPFTMGCEVAGVVEQGAGKFKAGDEVFAFIPLVRNGAFAEYVIALEPEVALKPSISFEHAAAIPVGALTASQALFEHGKLESGQTVLIHGAAGVVGAMAVLLARSRGAHVIGTASGENLDYLRAINTDVVVDYKSEKFEDKAHAVDLVFDTVGGETLERSFSVLKKGATLVSIAGEPSAEQAAKFQVTAHQMGVHPDGERLTEIAAMVDAGQVKPRMDRVFPFAEALEALAQSENGSARGKLVLKFG